jgi:cytochrome b6-f complex iron-sulfur subunit
VAKKVFKNKSMSETENNIKSPEKEPATSRRSLLTKLWDRLGVVALAELISLVFAFFKPRKQKISAVDRDAIIIAGPFDSFLPGTVTAFVRGKFYLARLVDGGFLALSRTCTHLGCTVPWVAKENKFICPCHSSEFDITGEVISPPAPRALDIYQVTIENNVVKIDTSKRIKRSQFAAGQITYPKNRLKVEG